MIKSFYKSDNRDFTIVHGDCFEVLPQFDFKFDMIFADPPYFLSNGGISYHAGKVVCVDKGEWDKGGSPESIMEFNRKWLSGTHHNIFSIATVLTELGYKILNVITWAKTNPPPNISCRFFTYSTEFIIWARKCPKVPHKYHYELMKAINDGKQMTDVWRLPAIGRWEKSCGKHPTQKPLAILTRIILASTDENDWILDPFAGSSTTGIAANLCGRKFLGIEQERDFAALSMARRNEIDNIQLRLSFCSKLKDLSYKIQHNMTNEAIPEYGNDLPF